MKIFRLIPIITILLFSACKKEKVLEKENLPDNLVLEKIKKLGFSTDNIITNDKGYIVEGDIFISKSSLDLKGDQKNIIVAKAEQYRTHNVIIGIPRIITISISNLGTNYIQGLDEAIARYNQLALGISFQRVASNGNIKIDGYFENSTDIAYAGFPTFSGEPHTEIKVNIYKLGGYPNVSHIASVLQHEIGHCIGMRHTDYMNRFYSCTNSTYANEGQDVVGATHIPGTPINPDALSWMLACINPNANRSFNQNDIISLRYLYPTQYPIVPIYSYYSAQGADHYLTPVMDSGNNYWAFEGITFKAYQFQATETIPIHSYYSPQGADHYFSTSRNLDGNSYWNYEGRAFYAFSTQVAGTVPVYVHYSPQGRDHYYSTSPIYGNSYWNFEGVAFYAFPK